MTEDYQIRESKDDLIVTTFHLHLDSYMYSGERIVGMSYSIALIPN